MNKDMRRIDMEDNKQTFPAKCPYTFEELFEKLEEEHRKRRAFQRLIHNERLDKEKCRNTPLQTLYEAYLVIIGARE